MHKWKARVSRGIWKFCCGELWNFANWPTETEEFGKIYRGKLSLHVEGVCHTLGSAQHCRDCTQYVIYTA